MFTVTPEKALLAAWSVAATNAGFGGLNTSARAGEGVPQAASGVLLDMFYGLSALRQVSPLAARKGVQAVKTIQGAAEPCSHCVLGECGGLQGWCLAKKLQALHSAGTAVSKVQSLERELCSSFPAEVGE